MSVLSNMSFSSLAQLSVLGQSIPIKEWEYSSGLLQLFFDYNFTLEGEPGWLSISLDPEYVITVNQTQNMSMTVQSKGRKLVYVSSGSESEMAGMVLGWLCVWAGLIAVADVLVGGMLAVELCFLCQCLFMLHFQPLRYSHAWSQLEQLTCSMVNPFYYVNQHSNVVLG